MAGSRQPARVGAAHATLAPYGLFSVGDGGSVLLSVQHEREWVSFCEIVLAAPKVAVDPRFADSAARVTNRDALHALINARFADLDTETLVALLNRAKVANARYNSVADFLDHPVLTGRDRWRRVDTPGGPIDALLPPATMTGVEARMDPVPAVGEHSEAILRELGYSARRIDALRAEHTV